MKHFTLLILTGLISQASVCDAKPLKRPNVIYVFPDQFRNMAMGFWQTEKFRQALPTSGDPVRTPNIDSFAKESVVLTSAMSNFPLSSPHRGSLLTGMYPNKSGIPLNCNSLRPISSLRTDVKCISDIFSENGYDCAYFGKLHAEYPTPDDPENPGHYVEKKSPVWDTYTPPERRHGFNYWYSYGTFDVHKNPHYWDTNGKKHEPHEWSPLHEAEQVIQYLNNKQHQRDSDKPFFIMVGMNPPHSPYNSLKDCMEEDYNLYKNKPLDSLLIRPNADKERTKAKDVRFYFASVTGVDRAFGKILSCLKELHLDKNTIVVFASDHGETMCSQGTDDPKNSPYSESMNIPFIVRFPGHLHPRTDDLLLSTPDIMPTLLGLSGLKDKIPETVQGTDFSSIFLNKNSISVKRPEGVLYIQNQDGTKNHKGEVIEYFPSARGWKTHDYTLALYIDKNKKLKKTLFFNDRNDPYQLKNIPLNTNSSIMKELFYSMAKQLKKIDDPWYKEKILSNLLPYDE